MVSSTTSNMWQDCMGFCKTTETKCCRPSCYRSKSCEDAVKLHVASLTTHNTSLRCGRPVSNWPAWAAAAGLQRPEGLQGCNTSTNALLLPCAITMPSPTAVPSLPEVQCVSCRWLVSCCLLLRFFFCCSVPACCCLLVSCLLASAGWLQTACPALSCPSHSSCSSGAATQMDELIWSMSLSLRQCAAVTACFACCC